MATHSSIFTGKIPWREDPGGLQSKGSKKSDTTEHSTAQPLLLRAPYLTYKIEVAVEARRGRHWVG